MGNIQKLKKGKLRTLKVVTYPEFPSNQTDLKSVVEAIKVLELLDDSDKAKFINCSTAFDPLVENQVNGGLRICDRRNPTVEAVE